MVTGDESLRYKGIPISVERQSPVYAVLFCGICGEEIGTIPARYLDDDYGVIYSFLCEKRLYILDHLETHILERREPRFTIPNIRKIRL